MITIQVTSQLEWSVIYRLEGVKASEVISSDFTVIQKEIAQKMRLEMGLAKGKVFTTNTGREI